MKTFKKAETLDDVKERIHEIVDYCKEVESPLGYFAALYIDVANNIERAIEKGDFDDNERLKKMDVNFVNYYIHAMNCAFNDQEAPDHWQVAIDASKKDEVIVLKHLFVAMNAHINYDLSNAVNDTVPKEDIIEFKGDFHKVNAILFALLNKVQDDVSNIFHPLKWYLTFGRTFDNLIIRILMGHMRDDAFAFTSTLALCRNEQVTSINGERMKEVSTLSEKILYHKKWWLRLIVKVIRLFEVGTPSQKISQLLK